MTDPTFLFFFCAPARQKMAGVFTERTITHLRDLLNQAGWKLTAVHYDKPSEKQISIAVPI
jgi:hypothetical protein